MERFLLWMNAINNAELIHWIQQRYLNQKEFAINILIPRITLLGLAGCFQMLFHRCIYKVSQTNIFLEKFV